MSSIKLNGLTKKFGSLTAVDNVTLSVEKGELFGLLGPNGAGKTTIINMLTTLLLPTSGSAKIEGYDIEKEADNVRRNIGIIFQEPSLDIGLTGKENLEFHAMMYGINSDERKKRINEVLEVVGLLEKADILVENYSGGMKRRLEIARGLIHHPKVLFLDEPTLGLDAQTRRKIWDYIKDLNKKYALSIVLTTHYMEEADYLCERIAIMDHGKIVSLDTPANLKNHLEGDIIGLEISGKSVEFTDALSKISGIKRVNNNENSVSITITDGEKKIPEIFLLAQNIGTEIKSVNLRKPSLEDVFIQLTGSGIREEEGNRHSHFHAGMRRRLMK